MASASPVFWSNGDHTASTQPLGFNEINPTFNRQFFEDFSVTNPGGITITGLWSENLIPRGSAGSILSLEWSIRTLMTESDDGVPVIVGSSVATLTPNGAFVRRSNNAVTDPQTQDFDGFQFLAAGLNIHLDPGVYSFAVTPVLAQDIPCFNNRATCAPEILLADGINAVGSPTGNFNGIQRSLQFVQGPPEVHRLNTQHEFAMGILADVADVSTATPTPEPGSLLMVVVIGVVGWVARSVGLGPGSTSEKKGVV